MRNIFHVLIIVALFDLVYVYLITAVILVAKVVIFFFFEKQLVILGLTIPLPIITLLWLFTNVADHKVAKINFDIFTYFKSFIRLWLSALHYNTNAGSNRRWLATLNSLVFPKAKKGDHAIRNIITQASRGGYDVDGAWELEGALFCLWLDTIKQLAFFSQPNFGDMKSNEFKIHLIKHKELTIMHSTLQITATALSQICLQSMRQIQGSSRST